MKKIILSLTVLSTIVLFGCSSIDYNHPLDSASAYDHPEYFQDSNNNGLADYWDPESEVYKKNLDTIPPELTLTGNNPVLIPYGDPNHILEGLKKAYTVTDNRDANPTVDLRNDDFSVIFPDTIEIEYTARDASGNSTTKSKIVIVLPEAFRDTVKPEISVSMKDIQIFQHEKFDPMKNVTAWDNIDTGLTRKIVVSGSVNTATTGEYTLTYTVRDEAGNEAKLVRKITVLENPNTGDTVFPVITLIGGDTVTIEETATWKDPGYKAEDNIDGDITEKVQVSGTVKSAPGWYTITYSVSDKAMNFTNKSRIVKRKGTIINGDTTPPVISLKFPRDTLVTVIKGAKFVLPELNILDNVDGQLSKDSVKVYPSINTNTIAAPFPVTLLISDKAQNEGRLVIKVQVVSGTVDTTRPVITLKGKNPDTVSVSATATYKDSGSTVTDNISKNLTAVVKGSVDRKTAGTYTLTYTATDAAGNVDSVKRVVVVKQSSTSDLLELYGVPQAKALASVSGDFKTAQVEGTGGPNLSSLTKLSFKFRNEQYSKGFDEFSITISGNYKNLMPLATQTLESPNPGIKLTGTGITNLDGEYYVTGDATKFIWVKIDGSFAIIWEP